jgi:aspartate-semialdehyde dehydrogenase
MQEKKPTVAVIGATGAVGREIVRLLLERRFPMKCLRLFASAKSIGSTVHGISVEALETLDGIDLAFFAAGSSVSKQWIPNAKCLCIDSSSAFRGQAPLIIPEINPHAIKEHRGVISSPNCTATVLLMPLFSLHRLFGVKRIVVSTYQAASGAGQKLMQELEDATRAHLAGGSYAHSLPFPYAFNLYPHNSVLHESGYVEEELKMRSETRKILEDETIAMSATCVRVPVLRAHSVSANVEFKKPFTLEEVYHALRHVPGVKLLEERKQNRFPTPWDATGKEEVFCGRFRLDPSQPQTLEFWAVGDQLLKGAALNAVQIAELAQLTKSSSYSIA